MNTQKVERAAKPTPGPWSFPLYMASPDPAELRKLGLNPVRRLTNDGGAIVMGGEPDDQRRLAVVDCQTKFKRGQGHQTDCAERDANARLIAAAPDMLAALQPFANCADVADQCAAPDERMLMFASDGGGTFLGEASVLHLRRARAAIRSAISAAVGDRPADAETM